MSFDLCRSRNNRPAEVIGRQETIQRLTAACADLAWWYGWPPDAVDNLTLDDFEAFQNEATRQMKAGFRKL
ncbi:GpE family phage tail protein [Bergeriella denitrificans]|uniref:GpE family phage tail protein n=1 Tax=Bergeriella denitrificans TaxID=494 RepID=UPI001FE55F80|nr:GpE family phage tail protein [Bergeriella denitrificans]